MRYKEHVLYANIIEYLIESSFICMI